MDAVTSYDTNSFLECLKRIVSHHGLCSDIYSDCGANFVGSYKELRDMFFKYSLFSKGIVNEAYNLGIRWHFNPHFEPHFEGLWKSAVRCAKHHLKRVIGNSTLTYEEMSTLLATIEACLNSRPLCALTEDPLDIQALTPAHFLLGRPLLSIPE